MNPISHISTLLSSSVASPASSGPAPATPHTLPPRGKVELSGAGLPVLGCWLSAAASVSDGADCPDAAKENAQTDEGTQHAAAAAVPDVVGCGQRVLVLVRGSVRVLVAKGVADGSVGAWLLDVTRDDEASLSATQLVQLHSDTVTAILAVGSWLGPQGLFLVTGSTDCTVRICWLGTGVPKSASAQRHWASSPLPTTASHLLHGHCGGVTCLAGSGALDVVVSGDGCGKCLLHTLSKGRFLRCFTHPSLRPILLLQMSDLGDIFMCGHGDTGVNVTDLHGLSLRRISCGGPSPLGQPAVATGETDASGAAISSMVLSDDGAVLLTGDVSGRVVVRAARCLTALRVLPRAGSRKTCHAETRDAVLSMSLSPSNNFLLIGRESGDVQVHLSQTQGRRGGASASPPTLSPVLFESLSP